MMQRITYADLVTTLSCLVDDMPLEGDSEAERLAEQLGELIEERAKAGLFEMTDSIITYVNR